jgi:hypothetical protein
VHDTCANGQTIKALTVVDEWTRECLAIEVASSLTAERVMELTRVRGHLTLWVGGLHDAQEACTTGAVSS